MSYNPSNRNTFDAIAYNAVGRSSEINNLPAYHLSHSIGNSGWSVGVLQWDLGQTGRHEKVDDLLTLYQQWAPPEKKFTEKERADLTQRLKTPGQTGNSLTQEEQYRLNSFLRSDPGRAFVLGLDKQQLDRKWEYVGKPLSQIAWLNQLSERNPNEAAKIVGMTAKLFNQYETSGRKLIHELQEKFMSSDDVTKWIGTHGVENLKPKMKDLITHKRDSALKGVELMNRLEASPSSLGEMWKRQIHDQGNASLSMNYQNNPEAQILDKMFRDPENGLKLLGYVEAMEADPNVAASLPSKITLLSTDESFGVKWERDGNKLTTFNKEGPLYQYEKGTWYAMEGESRYPLQNVAPQYAQSIEGKMQTTQILGQADPSMHALVKTYVDMNVEKFYLIAEKDLNLGKDSAKDRERMVGINEHEASMKTFCVEALKDPEISSQLQQGKQGWNPTLSDVGGYEKIQARMENGQWDAKDIQVVSSQIEREANALSQETMQQQRNSRGMGLHLSLNNAGKSL